jgi:HlyD family secretion protein
MLTKLFKQILGHKLITGIILVLILIGGYFGYNTFVNKNEVTRYLTTAVERGTLIVSVSGSGQVAVLDQVDIKPKVSGDVIWIGINAGEEVQQGQAILSFDETDIQKEIADAEWDLDEAKEDYDEIIVDAERTLATAYEDGYSTVSTIFFKLSDYITDLKDVLGTEKSGKEYVSAYELILGSDSQFVQRVIDDYDIASDLFNENYTFFREVYKDDDRDTIYQLISDTLETTEAISQTLESARHMYDAITIRDYQDFNIASQVDEMQPKIESDISSIYSNISSLQQIKDTIDDTNKDTPKDIATAKKDLQEKEDALEELKEELNNHVVKTPFAGIITEVNVKKGDSVSSGTTLATLVTEQKIAEVTLNEVDAAEVKVGQKATITFDAIDDLSITGEVAEVDVLGTVSQGVVTYDAKIAFDTQDERVKPGMSVSVTIITNVKQDALMVLNAAIKYQGDIQYVEVMSDDNSIVYQQVEIGLSNDTQTEIISGLEEGDEVVSSQTTGSSSSSDNNESFGPAGGNSMDVMRMMR